MTTSGQRVVDLVARGESLGVEFKRDVNDVELVEAVTCLANAGGGTLLVGVDDSGAVVGARRRHSTETDVRRVEALVSNTTRPSLGTRAELVDVAGRPVLVLDVPRAEIPTATASGRYLRRVLGGDGKPACVPFFIFEVSQPPRDPSEAVVPGATMADLDPLELARFRRFVRESGGRGDRSLLELSDEDLCRALGGLDANGVVRGVRRVALLLFGHEASLRRFFPSHEVAWQVLDVEAVQENEFFRLPLLRVLEEIESRFRARNRKREVVKLQRIEIPDYAEEGFREALVNALVHRDYMQLGAVHVQWTRDGLHIRSPGGLPEGVRLDNILAAQRPRNLLLADAFKRAGIVERTGRGVDTIFRGQLRYGRRAPTYDVGDHSVSVTLAAEPGDDRFVEWLAAEGRAGRTWGVAELMALRLCVDSGSVTPTTLSQAVQVEGRAQAALDRLVDAGSLVRSAAGYQLAGSARQALGGGQEVDAEAKVLALVRRTGRVTRQEAADVAGLSVNQAAFLLKKMRENKAIALVGRGKGAHYVPAELGNSENPAQ